MIIELIVKFRIHASSKKYRYTRRTKAEPQVPKTTIVWLLKSAGVEPSFDKMFFKNMFRLKIFKDSSQSCDMLVL